MAGTSETTHFGSKAGGSILSRSPETALWVIIASGTLTVMEGAILGSVVNGIQVGLEVSGSPAGLIITTHGLFIVLASPVAGSLINRYGSRRPYVLELVLYAFSGGAGLVVGSFGLLLVSRAFLGEEPTRTFEPSAPTTAMLANDGFEQDSAERILVDGAADLVSFGKSFTANPDLPERFRQGAPLNRPNPETFYAGGEQGYTDYPALSSSSE